MIAVFVRTPDPPRAVRGFTLIEILVVVVIIGILAAVIVPNVLSRIEDAEKSAAVSEIKTFDTAIDNYKLDLRQYPPVLEALVNKSAAGDNPKWNGPYLKNQTTIPKDPWGTPYIYKVPGEGGREYDISSAGKDRVPNTGDDIKGWDLKGTGK